MSIFISIDIAARHRIRKNNVIVDDLLGAFHCQTGSILCRCQRKIARGVIVGQNGRWAVVEKQEDSMPAFPAEGGETDVQKYGQADG